MSIPTYDFIPQRVAKGVSARVMERLGIILHAELRNPLDCARVTLKGIDPAAVDLLVEEGFSRRDLDWIVPARTLTHRRQQSQPLTIEESGRWLRAAKLHALAQEVLGDKDKAMSWLQKPRKVFGGESAMELMKTEMGAQLVEEALIQLDEGYFA
jgi:putative toxin-antitoxin system antitoxin component (TIGR02293 family)